MIKFRIVAVGNIKEDYLKQAIVEYTKRINKYAKCEIIECNEEKLSPNPSSSEIATVLDRESDQIIKNLSGYSILCDIDAKQYSSQELAENIKQITPFQKLPLDDNSIGSIVFDPPFVISPKTCKSITDNKKGSCLIHKRFASFYPVSELYYNYYWWIKEAYRTLKDNGLLIVKCMSTVSGGYQHNSEEFVFMTAMNMGFYCKDKYILQSKSRLVSSAKYKKQQHARKYTSVFYVFQKNPKMLNKFNYFELINKMNNEDLEGMVWELK
jgi:rRNA large subunit m3Psi methyltransferase RlmH